MNRPIAIRAVMFAGGLACGAGLATVAALNFGDAQPAAAIAKPPSATAPEAPSLSPEASAAIDKRIGELRARLGITAAQSPLWSAFAEAMRDNAAATQSLFAKRAAAVETMSAIENMRSYALIARAYADNTERLAAAFDRLYASLSDTQKRAADTLFREQAIAAARPQPEH